MGYFARVNSDNIVEEVIVANQAYIDSGAVGDASQWIEASDDGSLRNVFPGKGYTYDPGTDAFYPPKPPQFPSWVWGYDAIARIWAWIPPIPCPVDPIRDHRHILWDEAAQQWIDNPDQTTWQLPKVHEAPEFLWDKTTQSYIENPIFDNLGIANPYK